MALANTVGGKILLGVRDDGTTQGKVHLLDRKDFDGGVVADIEDAVRFVERNTRLAYCIEGLVRQDLPEYPTEALHEAITNAVMHRDRFFAGANVFVEVYSDRIEVSSPGSLPKGMTVDDLGHKSIRRNPLVADLLHRIGFIEKAGTGIGRIRDEAQDPDCPDPQFEADSFVTVTFRPNPEVRMMQTDHLTVRDAVQVTGEVAREVTGEVRLLRVVSGETTRRQLQEALRLQHEDHLRETYLLPALRAGLIEMTIPDKPRSSRQRYRLTSAGLEYLKRTDET